MDARPLGRWFVGALVLLLFASSVGAAAYLSGDPTAGSEARVLGARVAADGATAVAGTAGTGAAGTATGVLPSAGGVTRAAERPRVEGPTGDGVWAVVVGIDDYPGAKYDLRAGVADAGDVEAALDRYGVPADQRRVMLDGAATLPAMEDALDWLVEHAGPRATAVLFFSGHVRQVSGDPDGDGEAIDEAFLMADGEELVDGVIAERLADLRAGQTWIAVAGCYGAGFDELVIPGRVLTAASPEDELAYENDRMGRTYLVEYMVRRAMLGDDPAGSVQAAFTRAEAEIRRDYPARVPVMIDSAAAPVSLGMPLEFPIPDPGERAPVSGPASLPADHPGAHPAESSRRTTGA